MTYDLAFTVGRFQPLHNSHLEYLLAAKDRCAVLAIGLPMFALTPNDFHGATGDRESSRNNPMSYFERAENVSAVLLDAGVPASEFFTTPFPYEHPDRIAEFIPRASVVMTTIVEATDAQKVDRLQAMGLQVEVLWTREQKGVGAGEVRELIRNRDPRYKTLVPPATADLVEHLELWRRL